MSDELKYKVTIEIDDPDERLAIGTSIHEQLRGKQDYIDSNIVLDIFTNQAIELFVMDDCKELPKIEIDLGMLKKAE